MTVILYNQEIVLALPWDEHMNTGRNSKQTTCLCRDTAGKGTLRAQRTDFNTLDNWGRKTPTSQKGKGTAGKKRLKGHGPKHIQYTRLRLYGQSEDFMLD